MMGFTSPFNEYLIAVTTPNTHTDTNEVPTACMMFNPPAYMSPGTIKNPPPMPKYPDAKPTKNPIDNNFP